jgi:hypothetical protein
MSVSVDIERKNKKKKRVFLQVSKKMKRLMKVPEFSTTCYGLAVCLFFILLYSVYLVYRILTSF